MVSSIQLGNFFNSGGKTVSGGAGGSGLDTASLVKGLTDAKLIPATQLQDKIKVNDGKSTAIVEFQTLLGKLRDSVNILRNPPGVGNAANDAFKYRTANISSNTGITGSDYVAVTVSPGASLQSYTITDITSIAKARKQSTGNITITSADASAVSATPTGGQFKAGTFTLSGKSITFNDGDSLNSVAAKFNSVSGATGVSASIIKVAAGTYQLSFSATKTGVDADFDFNNISKPGTLVDAGGVFTSVTVSNKQDAKNAIFKLNGATITRQTNTIGDAVDGVSITLKQDTVSAPLTEIYVDVAADQTIAKNSIVNFLNAYNDLRTFSAKQAEVGDDGLYKNTAVLHDSALLRNTMNSINSQLASMVGGLGASAPSRLSDLGITFIDQAATKDTPAIRNLLTVDDAKLETAISSNADAVRKVFEFDFVTDNTAVRVVSRTNALQASSFDVSINPSLSSFTATYNNGSGNVSVDLDATAVKSSTTGLVTGYSLKGKAGTAFEGLTLVFVGTGNSTAHISATQGVADKLFNIADPALTADTGSIAVELTSLKSSDTRLTDNIAKINAEVEVYRQQLLDKFSRLEQAISSINALLTSLTANDNARNNK